MSREEYKPNMNRLFRIPRVWSNRELKKFAGLFTGDVVNVSGWKDEDKEGSYYRSYFENAGSYKITNYTSEKRGYQGADEEIALNLEEPLPEALKGKFDVVFNHTVLEHIYKVHTAFGSLCEMSKDVVIIVVPFLQVMHGAAYGDYWRFTPMTIKNLFEENGMELMYNSFNSHPNASVYLFCIGVKDKAKWAGKIPEVFNYEDPYRNTDLAENRNWVGAHAVKNPPKNRPHPIKRFLYRLLRRK